MKIYALILAKLKSDRLPYKNLIDFKGKPMFLWNTEKCLGIFEKTYVSSDSTYILNLAESAGAIPIVRPEELCGNTPNMPSYRHAQKTMKADIIIAVQANSPTLEEGLIEMTREIMMTGCPELMTCHKDYSIYGSIWALTKERLKNYKDPYKNKPDVLIIDNSIDIHTISDLKKCK
jgi:CMP-2-keto-3-deoxyoctulosonic acid synthetase